MATLVAKAAHTAAPKRELLAYKALLVFSFLYYARPEDVIPGLGFLPVGKISGGIALLALIVGLAGGKAKTKIPIEIKVLLLLLCHLCIGIPFAYWRGGAFATVTEKFSKGVIVALLVALIVVNIDQLRKLLYVQAAAVATMTFASVIIHPGGVRLAGVLGGIFENPNDLAINIAINWPLCLAFLLAARSAFRKVSWLVGLLAMLYAVVATYSRSGLMAMIVSLAICLWEFGVRGKRFHLLAIAGILGVVGAGVALATPHYMTRIESMFTGNIEGSGDHGSWEARRTLLKDSVKLTIHNPIFGVGAGNFPSYTETWRVAHNTYTEFSAEGGIPALLLFLTILVLAFRNLRKIRKTARYAADENIRLFTSAMWASLAAYMVGAAFASTEYTLFPYFMVAYTSAMYRIASVPLETGSDAPRKNLRAGMPSEQDNGASRKPELVWNR